MIASAQFTIISLCDVVTSDTPPENPYEGQLWVDTSVTPPETKIWDGNEWVVQNDIETIRTTISILTEKDAQFQQTIDGLNSYVATLTETVETVSNDQGVLEERILNSESRVSELEHTVDGLSVTMQEQYIGGINYVQNSSGLNGITDDWSYSGTVKTDTSTDTQNNTISDSCFVLGAYSSLSQYIRGVVPGTYTISVRAKKTSTMRAAQLRSLIFHLPSRKFLMSISPRRTAITPCLWNVAVQVAGLQRPTPERYLP